MTRSTTTADRTNWQITYDGVDPIRIRDPVAEALGVLQPGDPFVITYRDVITEAGHSCPTASGAFRIAQLGLEALYPDAHPVRGDIEVTAAGSRDDQTYGVMSRIISYVTGAAQEDGFGGLAGGYGGRQHLLHFDGFDAAEPSFRFERNDTGDAVQVTYHVGDVPDAGPATSYLTEIIDGSASAEKREEFSDAWHARVETVLTDDDLFTVTRSPD
ncbi:MAG: FmdE family protein [Halodesulfurarchaeum sp.]